MAHTVAPPILDWFEAEAAFRERVERLVPGSQAILDVGGGSHPFLSKEQRARARYVGLDISAEELAAAAGNYDETVVSAVEVMHPELAGRFDLAISWQVLEHVTDLALTIENVRAYLKPGGTFAAQFSARWSIFGVINRVTPEPLRNTLLRLGTGRSRRFPAPYHRGYLKAFLPLFDHWAHVEVVPMYCAYGYLGRIPPLASAYRALEQGVFTKYPNLASHYQIYARA